MKPALLLLTSLGLGLCLAGLSKPDQERLNQAIAAVLTQNLPDTAEAQDRYGFFHRVFVDSAAVWYQTDEPYPPAMARAGPGKQTDWLPAIRIGGPGASNPKALILSDRHQGMENRFLAVLWSQTYEHSTSVLCARRLLIQPFWQWTETIDLTPEP